MNGDRFEDFGIDVPGGRGGDVKTKCPMCSRAGLRSHPNDRSLSVNLDNGVFHCHYCGWKGGLKKEGVPGMFGRSFQPPKVYAKPDPLPEGGLTPNAKAFFTKRLISLEAVEKRKITVVDGALKFPYFIDGVLINVKTRYPGKKFKMETGSELAFWGLDECAAAEQVIIVEGELDTLACDTAGLPYTISVPNGASIGKMEYLESGLKLFDQCHTVILAVDMDEPGRLLEAELARRIGKEKCFYVRFPDGCKDANDVLVNLGVDALRACMSDAMPVPIDGAHWLNEYMDEALALRENPLPSGISLGWRSIDPYYKIITGEWTVVTGYPGSGKSEFMDAVMINLARTQDWKFAVYSPENRGPDHFIKMAEKWSGDPFFTNSVQAPMSDATVREFGRWAESRFIRLEPEKPTMETLLGMCRTFVVRDGVRGILLDPWNRMDHSRPAGVSGTEHVRDELSKVSDFCRANDVHIWLTAHPTKPLKIDGETPVPTPYDISDSAHFFNMSDNCFAIYRDKTDESSLVEFHAQKLRTKRLGMLGVARLRYNYLNGRYSEP